MSVNFQNKPSETMLIKKRLFKQLFNLINNQRISCQRPALWTTQTCVDRDLRSYYVLLLCKCWAFSGKPKEKNDWSFNKFYPLGFIFRQIRWWVWLIRNFLWRLFVNLIITMHTLEVGTVVSFSLIFLQRNRCILEKVFPKNGQFCQLTRI